MARTRASAFALTMYPSLSKCILTLYLNGKIIIILDEVNLYHISLQWIMILLARKSDWKIIQHNMCECKSVKASMRNTLYIIITESHTNLAVYMISMMQRKNAVDDNGILWSGLRKDFFLQQKWKNMGNSDRKKNENHLKLNYTIQCIQRHTVYGFFHNLLCKLFPFKSWINFQTYTPTSSSIKYSDADGFKGGGIF